MTRRSGNWLGAERARRAGVWLAVLGMLGASAPAASGPVFTRIANDGHALVESAAFGPNPGDWGCSRDDVSGLMWEVKTRDGGPRDRRWTYTPYDDNPATNGGFAGYRDTRSGDCVRAAMPGGSCNTQAYIEMVNARGLCGHGDWRLPTMLELTAVAAQTATAAPGAAATMLPNIAEGWYWTGVLRTGSLAFARVVLLPPAARPSFYDGSYRVLLVRDSILEQ